MALSSKFLLWFCCSAWLCVPSCLGSQASRGEAQIAASAELESEAEPWSSPQPADGSDGSGLLLPLLKVLSDGRGGAPRLQPDSRALRYMKKLYKAYATKEGIPKSNRSHLYNTVRLFTPCAQHKQAPGDQVTGALPAVDLLFNLDRVTAVEHPLKSVLLYTVNNSVSFSSAVKCACNLVIKEPESSGKSLPGAAHSFTFNSRFEFGKKHKWVEVDVTALLQPLLASNRQIHMSASFTCTRAGRQRPPAQEGRVDVALAAPPALILYLNDTGAQARHGPSPADSAGRPSQGPAPQSNLPACPRGEEAAEDGRFSRHRRGQETVVSELRKPLAPASLNLSEYFKQFVFPQNECELHDFRLSFRQLKWDTWIVAPHRYNPRFCKGDCPKAAGHRYGSRAHTTVQNIIHETLDPSVPRPSCVPAEYGPLSLLTVEPDGSVAYKEYEDMIATKCTCR
ncbi:LOW QUALITY PROTEIN: growth/differentiation factor 9 [Lemur catta]|uniref:LOW QUALITY PROTEIN: growth/differentiation factor 9 n=1 Tax=Lemur catta TaxID=9447 RepID=UPI001E269D7F|nr:LOW QUALITY PROTEIN: growth/differentiation factor 9 [Lemur catta]